MSPTKSTTPTRATLPPEVVRGTERAPEASDDDLSELPYRDAIQRLRTDGVRRYLEGVLPRFGGNVTTAPDRADVEGESFYRLCRQHGVNPNEFRPGGDEGGGD